MKAVYHSIYEFSELSHRIGEVVIEGIIERAPRFINCTSSCVYCKDR